MKSYNSNPLVTVVVCTYNSAEYILETLESIRQQDYMPLELVVSDDASTDNTQDLVKRWVAEFESRVSFKRIELLEVSKNTGVSANANRALKVSHGQWIKYIAADDALKPDCISKNVQWVKSKPGIRILFSRVEIYAESFEPANLLDVSRDDSFSPRSIMAPGKTAEEQYKMLLLSDRIHFSPSLFLQKEALLSVGGFDEEFRLLEDYPLWLNLTRNGHKLYFMNEITVCYRRHNSAINNNEGLSFIVNPNYFKTETFRKKYIYPALPSDLRLEQKYKWVASQFFRLKVFNRDNRAGKFLYTLITRYTNPFTLLIKIRKLLINSVKEDILYQ